MSFATSKCFLAREGDVERHWYHISAKDQVLGRLASRIAVVLMGKHKPTFTRHVDTGDFVVVTEVDDVKLTGRKVEQKYYDYYTYHAGGRRVIPYKSLMKDKPQQALMLAVRRMLPKNAMGRKLLTKLKIYRGSEHPHQAQQPQPLPTVR